MKQPGATVVRRARLSHNRSASMVMGKRKRASATNSKPVHGANASSEGNCGPIVRRRQHWGIQAMAVIAEDDKYWQSPKYRSETAPLREPNNCVLTDLAEIAKVPAARRPVFCKAILNDLNIAWEDMADLHKSSDQIRENRNFLGSAPMAFIGLRQVAKCSDDILNVSLNERARLLLQIELKPTELSHVIDAILSLQAAALRAANALVPQPVAKPRGRPRNVSNTRRQFTEILALLFFRALIFGGRFTLDKNTGAGTIYHALSLLRPYLPPGFIPHAPPLGLMQEVATAVRRDVDWIEDKLRVRSATGRKMAPHLNSKSRIIVV